jgi:hypothetical protein
MSGGILASLLPGINSILSIRDSIGASKQPVYFLNRTWFTDGTFTVQSTDISGSAKDVLTQMLPSPQIVTLTQEIKAREGGTVKNGDIMLKMISQESFNEAALDGSSSANNVENLFIVGVKVYQVVKVTQEYVTWNLVLKELTNQTRY